MKSGYRKIKNHQIKFFGYILEIADDPTKFTFNFLIRGPLHAHYNPEKHKTLADLVEGRLVYVLNLKYCSTSFYNQAAVALVRGKINTPFDETPLCWLNAVNKTFLVLDKLDVYHD